MRFMNTLTSPIALCPGRTLTLSRSPHWLLVLEGRVWLTSSGDPDDHFLHAGQRLRLAGRQHVVVQAEGAQAARCQLVPGGAAEAPANGGAAAGAQA